jgi:hypothetical protein
VKRPLPDTTTWRPREPGNAHTVSTALSERCALLEKKLLLGACSERNLAFDAFDSGVPIEQLLREVIEQLLPTRYETTAGTVVDACGFTAGEMDLVVFNPHWFPQVHASSSERGTKKLLPFEGVYAVGEVKQTLTERSLDEAMEKLVACHRLARSSTPRSRITENREFPARTEVGLANPLYSFIVGTAIAGDLQPLIERFFDINKSLERLEVVRALCVLGKGTMTWAVTQDAGVKPALFMSDDLTQPLIPAYSPATDARPALFSLFENLLLHLYHCVLSPEDIASQYGPLDGNVKVPDTDSVALSAQSTVDFGRKRLKRTG